MKVSNKTIPVQASLHTLKGCSIMLEHLLTANRVFENAGFERPYKLNTNDEMLQAFCMGLEEGHISTYRFASDNAQFEALAPLGNWRTDNDDGSKAESVFVSFVDTDAIAVKFVYTLSKFGVAISRGYLLDLVSKYNNLLEEQKKKTQTELIGEITYRHLLLGLCQGCWIWQMDFVSWILISLKVW